MAEARPQSAAPGQTVTFDGSASSDDRQAPEDLTYSWDFTNNGTFDATGQVVTHAYGAVGTYTARLRVTDGGGKTADDTVVVTVSQLGDLKVTKLSTTNVTVNGTRYVRVYATVKNIGGARTGASTTIFHVDDSSVPDIGRVKTPGLNAGQAITVSKLWDARQYPGPHRVRAHADGLKRVAEANETNNFRGITVTISKGWAQ